MVCLMAVNVSYHLCVIVVPACMAILIHIIPHNLSKYEKKEWMSIQKIIECLFYSGHLHSVDSKPLQILLFFLQFITAGQICSGQFFLCVCVCVSS